MFKTKDGSWDRTSKWKKTGVNDSLKAIKWNGNLKWNGKAKLDYWNVK